jgi:hypothetical protein
MMGVARAEAAREKRAKKTAFILAVVGGCGSMTEYET